MKLLLFKLLGFVPIIGLLIGVNYFVDPANLYKHIEKGIADILLSGKNAANVGDRDERLVVKYYAQQVKDAPDVLVLGSSRTLEIDSKMLAGSRIYNASVSGATVRDDMAIYGMFRSRGLLPDEIILGLDPWLLNARNGQPRWTSVREYYEYTSTLSEQAVKAKQDGVSRTGPGWEEQPRLTVRADPRKAELTREKYLNLLSPTYFQAGIKKLWKNYSSPGRDESAPVEATKSMIADQAILRSDGSLSYPRAYRERDEATVSREARSYANAEPIYSLGAFKELDPQAISDLEGFLDLLEMDGVNVRLVLIPYHPVVYKKLGNKYSSKYRLVPETEKYFRSLAVERGLPIIGSFNPAVGGYTSSDFYDGMHLKREQVTRMVRDLTLEPAGRNVEK